MEVSKRRAVLKIHEPIMTADLDEEPDFNFDLSNAGRREWHSRALRVLASQLGVGCDFYYPLLGAAQMIDEIRD